jgi:hypothetical protein
MDPHPASPAPPAPRRIRPEPEPTRPGVLALAAVLTELVVIGAVGNQWISKHEIQWILNENKSAFVRDLKSALFVFNWRFAPESGDVDHTWLSQLTLIVVTCLLTAAFVGVATRGPATFGRMFVTSWLAALGAALIATYVRALVKNQPLLPGDRVQKAIFGPLSPSTLSIFADIVLALVAGLVAAIVGNLVGRRVPAPAAPAELPPAAEPAYVPPEQPPPFNPVPRPGPGEASAGAPTAAFPRPPDDDDLEHDVHPE